MLLLTLLSCLTKPEQQPVEQSEPLLPLKEDLLKRFNYCKSFDTDGDGVVLYSYQDDMGLIDKWVFFIFDTVDTKGDYFINLSMVEGWINNTPAPQLKNDILTRTNFRLSQINQALNYGRNNDLVQSDGKKKFTFEEYQIESAVLNSGLIYLDLLEID